MKAKRNRVRIIISLEAKKFISENYYKITVKDIALHLGLKYGTIYDYINRNFIIPEREVKSALNEKKSKFFDSDEYLKTLRTI
jgi:hypothetical protein